MSDPEQGKARQERGEGEPERAPLGILFLAAAVALALLLTVVGLIAFAVMSPRSPALLEEPDRRAAGLTPS